MHWNIQTLQRARHSNPKEGTENAPAAIIEFADFECTYCAKDAVVLKQLRNSYGERVLTIFKHYPLSIHPLAPLAHEAVLAANAQGKMWEMHDLIFANPTKLSFEDLVQYADSLNLDLAAFREALSSHEYKHVVEENVAEGRALGVTATPTFFVNGERLVGFQTLQNLEQVVDRALNPETSRNEQLFDTEAAETIQNVPIAGSPFKGAATGAVTIVEFSDFECPSCKSALPIVEELIREYPKDVKLVFKNYPLHIHPNAELAHRAAMAANEQGKFWSMHDWIFAHQESISRDDLIRAARELGLNEIRFSTDLESRSAKLKVDVDRAEGEALGVSSTPLFFVNGRKLSGLTTLDLMKRVVDEQLLKQGLQPPAKNQLR